MEAEEGVVIIFRSRLDENAGAEYQQVSARMLELASQQPGFRGIKTFVAEDGERVSISEFDSLEAAMAWRAVPEHRDAQILARERFYEQYEFVTCKPLRRIRFEREGNG
jgi:heme-degrading monooxygenase HmoA